MTSEELRYCSCADIMECPPDSLADLKYVDVAAGLPVPLRMEHYMHQIKNPYLFRVDKLIVKVTFSGKRDLASVLAGLMAQG